MAQRKAGVAPIRAPSDAAILERIEAAITPLRLPTAVRRFWDLVDLASIYVHPHPDLTSAEFALQTWESHVSEAPGMVPRVLFPIGYESHSHLFVELDGPDQDGGGAIFSWCYGGCDFRLVFADLAGLLDWLTAAVAEGLCVRRADHLYPDAASLVDKAPDLALHPVFGAIDSIPQDLSEWPESWLARSDITSERRHPAGADHTIAEVLTEAQLGPMNARIRGTVTELAGSGEGVKVTVTDGTGTMRIWCPAAVTVLGPRIGGAFEFHITAPARDVPDAPDFGPLASDPRLADLPVDLDAVVTRLASANAPIDATATEIRATEDW